MKNLKKLIKEVVSKVLGENDFLTHSIDESIRVLNNTFKDNLSARINETNESIIDVYVKKYNIDTLVKIDKTIENLGYFISIFSVNGFQKTFKKDSFFEKIKKLTELTPIYLKLEKKRDSNEDTDIVIPSILYHITHERHLEKIKKIGLVPKSKSKKSAHPERIYLAGNEESAIKLVKEFSNLEYEFEHNYVLLEIDTNKAVEFKRDKNFKLNKDPNFTEGYFTYDNIPPTAINFENMKVINIK